MKELILQKHQIPVHQNTKTKMKHEEGQYQKQVQYLKKMCLMSCEMQVCLRLMALQIEMEEDGEQERLMAQMEKRPR